MFVDGAEAGAPSEEVALASVCSHRRLRAVPQQLPWYSAWIPSSRGAIGALEQTYEGPWGSEQEPWQS